MRKGFTLAEVLITLGIIGVVAALTMPTLIMNYEKKSVATSLKKFYSIMSQAVALVEVKHGEYKYWSPDNEPDFVANSSDFYEVWYNRYLDKNIKSIEKKKISDRDYRVTLSDGSGFVSYIDAAGGVAFFYCTNVKYCGKDGNEVFDGQHSFLFTLNKYVKKVFIPFNPHWPREKLLEGCKYGNNDNPKVSSSTRRHTCATLIMQDGWEIRDDYPWNPTILPPAD